MEAKYCQHHDCQCEAAADLAWMGSRLLRHDLLDAAVDIHKRNTEVRCRRVRQPRRGICGTGEMAPLPWGDAAAEREVIDAIDTPEAQHKIHGGGG